MIHICMPARDEAATIGILLWKIRKVMADFGRDYEVTVLDDGSTDDTREVLDRYRRHLPLRVLRNETSIGYGAAMTRLLRDATARAAYPKRDVVITLQADFTESPNDLVPMVKAVEGGADLVAGRLVPGIRPLPAGLRFGRQAARFVVGRGASGAPVADPFSGFRAYRVVVLKKAFRDADDAVGTSVGDIGTAEMGTAWAANLDILARTAPHARRIDEAPYELHFTPRVRETRLRVLGELRALLPLRRVRWDAPASEAA